MTEDRWFRMFGSIALGLALHSALCVGSAFVCGLLVGHSLLAALGVGLFGTLNGLLAVGAVLALVGHARRHPAP